MILDHIAIAVPDFAKAIARLREDFGLQCKGTEDVAAADTKTAFFPVPATHIELIHPMEGKGPVARFLERKGGGLHHLCFRTDDLEADILRLKAKGYEFLSDEPLEGAKDSKVIFIHPRSCDGVLVELNQRCPCPEPVGDGQHA